MGFSSMREALKSVRNFINNPAYAVSSGNVIDLD